MARILVTGVGGPAGGSVAAMLRARGHSVTGVDARELAPEGIRFSRVPMAADPGFLDELARVAARERIDLLIPTVTEELPVVAAGWRTVSRVAVMIGPAEGVRAAHDKYLTCRRLSDCGVAVPRFSLPSQVQSPDDVRRRLGWPCLSKPRTGRGGRGVAVHPETEWERLKTLDDATVLQEFLPGVDYCADTFLPRDRGEPPLIVVLEKTRLKEGIVGNASEVRRVSDADVKSLAAEAGACLGLIGPIDVDIRRGTDGRPAVLEINARFGANLACAPEILDAALADWGLSG